ncbi:MAG: BrnA antitoxin family protein [Rhizobiaceae bacterium]|nr:BrnA antitoxin family protein [Rhizobiaceae bacterium]
MQKTREEARRLALKYADEMTAEEDAALTAAALADPDNPPRNAGGRPKSENPKEAVKLRIDADVLARFREGGRGWQTRMNEALRKAVGL